MNKINWFWAHRRNSSLLHLSMLFQGFRNKGFLPAVDFYFKNQIAIGKPGKGCYFFYDNEEIERKYKDINQSILKNMNFANDFRIVNDKIFDELFKVCKEIEASKLDSMSDKEILDLVLRFKEKITKGPLITVQLWGIEACWNENFRLSREVKSKVGKRYDVIKGDLSQSTGKSVAFSERESFLKTLLRIQKKIDNSEIMSHVDRFGWVNSEYVSKKLGFDEWKELFVKEINMDAGDELEKLFLSYNKAIDVKKRLMDELELSEESRHILSALDEFVCQRDWAKGKFCYALDRFNLLLDEIIVRKGMSKEDVLNYSIDELIDIIKGKNIDNTERKDGFALVSLGGNHSIYGKTYENVIAEHGLGDVFSDVERVMNFRGVIANKGNVRGKVRVIDDAKDINKFEDGEILVTYMTTMEFTPLFKKAKGIITDEGGLSSHAAIISREFDVPCIVGTQIATRTLKTGDVVEMDDKGCVRVCDD